MWWVCHHRVRIIFSFFLGYNHLAWGIMGLQCKLSGWGGHHCGLIVLQMIEQKKKYGNSRHIIPSKKTRSTVFGLISMETQKLVWLQAECAVCNKLNKEEP